MRFTQAIVRPPAANFHMGISSSIGTRGPAIEVALAQHERYCEMLRACGLQLTRLAADLQFPDGTFIEDTAVLTAKAAIVTRPGAASRAAETAATLELLRGFFDIIHEINAPGTLDGGDVCEIDDEFVIGLSQRTNEEGVRQLTSLLADLGHKSIVVDIRECKSLLHLKSGLSYLGNGVFVGSSGAPIWRALERFEIITVSPAEDYAANCLRVNDRIVIAAGYPNLLEVLSGRGYRVEALAMSEFKKMDGGLSCLSLRF